MAPEAACAAAGINAAAVKATPKGHAAKEKTLQMESTKLTTVLMFFCPAFFIFFTGLPAATDSGTTGGIVPGLTAALLPVAFCL